MKKNIIFTLILIIIFSSMNVSKIYSYKIDDKAYREYLKEFLEKKYYLNASTRDGYYVGNVEFLTGKFGEIYYYNQGDYANHSYGGYGTIASHGCGPTALSICISSILKEKHTPVELTNYVCSIGGCSSAGTYWSAITTTPSHYGLKSVPTSNEQEVIDALASGDSLVIALMCAGTFTTSGHFIVLTGTSSDGTVTVADPASRERSSKIWPFNTIAEESCKETTGPYWVISK